MTRRIIYLFTTFPKSSEQFLQRELRGLSQHSDLDIEIHSMTGGSGKTFVGFPVRHLRKRDWLALPWRLIAHCVRNPSALLAFAQLNDAYPPRSWINGLEHYLGLAFAIIRADEFKTEKPLRIHAVWATGPASAALLLRYLDGQTFSMGCHAYDLFRHGGDVLLGKKIETADFIHTTTQNAANELRFRGADPGKLLLVRRSVAPAEPRAGTAQAPAQKHLERMEGSRSEIHILAVGRLVEKKGFFKLLEILRELRNGGIRFRARIIGDGALRAKLEQRVEQLDLEEQTQFCGELPFDHVQASYQQWADLFFFTGHKAGNGDRDGLPNVILEAMAADLIVFAARDTAAGEAIVSGETGVLLDPNRPGDWLKAVRRFMTDPERNTFLRQNARAWLASNCDPRNNAVTLAARLTAPPMPQ